MGSSKAMATLLSSFIIFYSLFPMVLSMFTTSKVPSGGPESIAFDDKGMLYTSVSDGRVLRFEGPEVGYVDFAYASPNRTKELCDGKTHQALGDVCGRPFGIGFHTATKQLYIADSYYGLCVVGPEGGLATQLLSGVGGLPFKFLDGLDIDQSTGNVYLTDLSAKYNLSEYLNINRTNADADTTGRLIEYNPVKRSAKLLLSGLHEPGGVAISKDSSYVLYSEYTGSKISKYWLQGSKANTSELLTNAVMLPDNIQRTRSGHYWVAANNVINGTIAPVGLKIDGDGTILGRLVLGEPFYNLTLVSDVHEQRGNLYVTAISVDFIGVCRNFVEDNGTFSC